MSESRVIHTMGVGDCGSRCMIHAHVNNGKIEKITTDTSGTGGCSIPLTACAKGMNYHKTFLSEERLKYPMKRIGARGEGKFERISWEEATDIIASEWKRIRDTYGPGSRFVTYATGVEGVLYGGAMARRLLNLDGGSLEYSNNYSTGCIGPATRLMYGTTDTGNSPHDWLNTKLIILMGHNPAETRFSHETMYYLREARKKGIPIICIDPRKTDTAKQLDAEWIPIRPATDSALLDAMAYVILEKGLQDQAFLDRCCVGFDEKHMPEGISGDESVAAYLRGKKDGIKKTPVWAEKITGIPAAEIEHLAVRYATAKPAMLIQGYGPQRHSYGEQGVRGSILLSCMTGNVGVNGGWAGGSGNIPKHDDPCFPEGNNPFSAKIPVFLWLQAVESGRNMNAADGVTGLEEGQSLGTDIKMMISIASNMLVNQHSDINRTTAILRDTEKCEFILCCDLFMTASAKYADILLPGASFLEMDNMTTPWKYGDFIGYCHQVVEPMYESRPEYDWLCDVAKKLGLFEEFSQGRTATEWLKALYEELRNQYTELPVFEQLMEQVIYHYPKQEDFVAFAEERRDPQKYPFPTESGKIELFSKAVYESSYPEYFPAIPAYVPPHEGPEDPLTEKYPLQLIGWHSKRRCHSIHDNNKNLHKLEPQRIWMHPEDAKERALQDGDLALVWNDRGKMKIPVHVTEQIMKGVTGIPEGAWYRPDKDGTDLGGCINVLTIQQPTAYAKANPQHSNLVEVKKSE